MEAQSGQLHRSGIAAGRYGTQAQMPIRDASFPKPFPYELEYNCPVHEHWNIVHTGMLIPETHAIYVCPDNCLRGVIMTADEWKGENRFSAVMPTEEDAVLGRLEQVTIDGVSRVIDRLLYRPRAVLVFLVCMHHFLGCDEKYIYRELERRYPDIHFLRCWMDPVMQKVGLTPEQKQRREMMLCIRSAKTDAALSWGSVLGDDYRLPESSDVVRILKVHGIFLHQVQDARTYEEYEQSGDAGFYLTRSPLSVYGLKTVAHRDGKPWVYLPPAATYEEIARELEELLMAALPAEAGDEVSAAVEGSPVSMEGVSETPESRRQQVVHAEVRSFAQKEIRQCEEAFAHAGKVIGNVPIAIDCVGCVRPLSTARLLLSHGLHVMRVYLDSILPEEKEDFLWLQANAPELVLQSTSHPQALFLQRANGSRTRYPEKGAEQTDRVLAIGPKAAYFENTPYFVNQIESGGNWGFDGIRRLLFDMCDALQEEKDLEGIVQRKGLRQEGGWELPAAIRHDGADRREMDTEEPSVVSKNGTGRRGECSERSAVSGHDRQDGAERCHRSAGSRPQNREAYRITPVPAGDVSGVCSALYELGGMVVMHDPSGCNSTYNTHDEVRWYRQKSSIYISGLNERDAVLGNDEKLIRDIVHAVEVQQRRPEFLALCNSPLPFLNGTDFEGICRVLEKRTGIPAFYVKTNGFHDYSVGAGNAFLSFAQKMLPGQEELSDRKNPGGQVILPGRETPWTGKAFPESGKQQESSAEKADAAAFCQRNEASRNTAQAVRVGVLGMTPLDYGNPENVRSLRRWLAGEGFAVVSEWSYESSFGEAVRMTSADVLLVVSASGMKAAQYLGESYGIPAVVAAPVAGLQGEVASAICHAAAGEEYAAHPWEMGQTDPSAPALFCCRAHPREMGQTDPSAAVLFSCRAHPREMVQTVLDIDEDQGYGAGTDSDRSGPGNEVFCLIGEPVLCESMAQVLRLQGHAVRMLTNLESASGLLDTAAGDRQIVGEEELITAVAAMQAEAEHKGRCLHVIADPLMKPVLPEGISFTGVPTLAYSGRMWQKEFPDFFAPDFWKRATEFSWNGIHRH